MSAMHANINKKYILMKNYFQTSLFVSVGVLVLDNVTGYSTLVGRTYKLIEPFELFISIINLLSYTYTSSE